MGAICDSVQLSRFLRKPASLIAIIPQPSLQRLDL